MAPKFIRLASVSDAQGGKAKSTIYRDINNGLLPPPLKLGASSVWIESEIEAVNRAVIAGKSDDEIRELVRQLIALRIADARYGDAVNTPAQQKKHSAGTHPTTIARRESTRRKATIRGKVL